MKTLKAFKNNKGTILMNSENKIVAYYPVHLQQPHRNRKTITHNCFKYNLEWVNTECKKELHWYNQCIIAFSKNLYKTFFNFHEPITEKFKNDWKLFSKNTPLEITFLDDWSIMVKIKTTLNV